MEEKSIAGTVSGQQQFNLRWNNHTNNILQVFMEQYANEGLVDVTIACDGHFIKAHKMVLSACSPYFQEIFRVHTVTHPVIIVNGMKHTDLKQIIEFMYRGEVKVLETELDSLLAVAESLQVKGLSTVRNTCGKEETTKSTDQVNKENNSENNEQNGEDVQPRAAKRKKSKSQDSTVKSEDVSDDESLASTIKIEPPEIKDIDQDEVIQEDTTEIQNMDEKSPEIETKFRRRIGILKKPSHTYVPILPKTIMPHKIVQQEPAVKVSKLSKVPRPPNAFMIFANEWRRQLASQHPKESNKEISVRLGIMWKNLTPDDKEGYYSASRKADEEHKRKYPGYYYSPKEARLRKNLKTLEGARHKRQLDAMHLVKLVMKTAEQCEKDRRLSSDQDKDEELEEEIDVEDDTPISITEEMDVEISENIDTAPDETV